ncbi:MAG: 30S ribosomal protein S6 [Patescibacteria group bacterium]
MKIIKDSRVRHYELTYLVSANITSEEAKKVAEAVLELVKKAKGQVLNTIDWGKKELSYMIKQDGERQYDAFYTHLELEMDAAKVQSLDQDLRILPDLMRYLLVLGSRIKVKAVQKEIAKSEVKPKVKTEVKSEVVSETKPKVKSEAKTKAETKPAVQEKVADQTSVETAVILEEKPETTSEVKEKKVVKPKAKLAIKTLEKKVKAKVDKKPAKSA